MSELPQAVTPVVRYVTRIARGIGCTCPRPDVRWNRTEGIPVIVHRPPCPHAPRELPETDS